MRYKCNIIIIVPISRFFFFSISPFFPRAPLISPFISYPSACSLTFLINITKEKRLLWFLRTSFAQELDEKTPVSRFVWPQLATYQLCLMAMREENYDERATIPGGRGNNPPQPSTTLINPFGNTMENIADLNNVPISIYYRV